MKKKFEKAAKLSAVDQVMKILLDGQGDDVPDALVEEALKQGLAKRFSFAIGPAEEAPEKSDYIAIIYPTELDETCKSPYNCIELMVPGAEPVDSCVVTEWHMPKGVNTPAKIAKFLTAQGLSWDREGQKGGNKLKKEITDALQGNSAGKSQKKPRR
jgi:hypothetical protein